MDYTSLAIALDRIIKKSRDLRVIMANSEKHPDGLSGLTEVFFSVYERVAKCDGSLEIDINSIGASQYFNDCISIGHVEYWEIVIRPGSDCIYVVDGSESSLTDTDSVYSNIYEYLIDELGG